MIARLMGAAAILVAAALPAMAQEGPYHAKARELLERSVAFRTAAGHGQVRPYIDYLRGELKAAGYADEAITVVPLGEEAAAMVVRVEGRDEAKKPILFSAHMDVVDADPADWERDPFKLVEEDGFFFGRGTIDNKAGVVGLVTTLIRIKKEGFTPTRDLVFAFIGDEETTMGTTKLLAHERKTLIDAEFAINSDAGGGVLSAEGKPLVYGIQGGEKTYADFELKVTNPGGHSSAPRADNAIYQLADALRRVQAHRFPIEANALTRSSLAAEGAATPGELGQAMRAFAADPEDAAAAERLRREPWLVGQTGTTCVATQLEAGHAPNALPQSAAANVNCRVFPGTTVAQVKAVLERLAGEGVSVEQVGDVGRESPVSEPREEVTQAVRAAVAAEYGEVPVAYHQSSGATDGREYRAAGIPTYGSSGIFIRAEDEFAHGLNERVPVESFYNSIDYWWRLVGELAGPRAG